VELSADGALGLTNFGKYRLVASLGQGGMANVYLAVVLGPAGFNKLLVVKALREDVLGNSDEFVHMFLDEARLSARLNHPNIVQTYEIGESDGRYFIAMEYLEGQPLRVVQRKLGPIGLPLEEELRIVAETARGLHHAHDLKGLNGELLEVVHRDVSPQNVFLTYDGQVKLLDFGIAKARDAEHLTKVGVIKGKLDYIAPEQIRGEKIDRRADVFSLGAMLWESVTGQRFAGGSKVQDVTKLHKRLTGGEPKAKEIKPDLPDQLAYIIDRALAVDPSDRHPTAAVLADEIETFLEKLGMRPSSKTLAERLVAPFAGERAKIGWLIEEQVKQAMQSNRSERGLPSIARAELTQSGSGVRAGLGFGDEGTDAGTGTPITRSQSGVVSGAVRDAASATPLAPAQGRGVLVSPAKLVAVAAALVGAVTLAVIASSKSEPQSASAAGPASGQVAAAGTPVSADPQGSGAKAHATGPAVAAVSSVKMHIFVSPPEAHVVLDGANLPKLPFTAELPRDGQLHYVEASAPGYATKKVVVPFDRDREVSIVLDKLPLDAASAARTGKRRERPLNAAPGVEPVRNAQSEDIAPGALIPSKRRVRTDIDTADPYAN
jgi:serine/threonine protein kinase